MTGRYKHILFDLDGTLTDSAEGVTRSVQYALQKFGLESTPQELQPFIGPPLQQSFQNHYGFSENKARQAVSYYREYFREKGIFQNRLYPSVKKMLERLSAGGARLYVATSKPTVFAEKVLQLFRIESFFELVVGSNLDGTRVDKAEVIGYLLEQIKPLDKTETVMVGDREHDILGAKACGLDSIAVTYGYGSPAELSAAGPTAIARSVPELTELLLSNESSTGS
jgi:phosphoglycolate phosphatase